MESLWKGQDCVSLVLNKSADINRLMYDVLDFPLLK